MQTKVLILFALVAVALAAEDKKPAPSQAEEKIDEPKKGKRSLWDVGQGYTTYSHAVPAPTYYTSGVHTNTVITKEVPVAVPHPVAVPYEKPVPYPVIQKVAVPVDRPVAVPVPKPYAVEVTKHVPVPVDRPYPVHVPYPVVKHVPAPYPVKVPQPYAVPVVKHVPVPYAQPIYVEKYSAPVVFDKWQQAW